MWWLLHFLAAKPKLLSFTVLLCALSIYKYGQLNEQRQSLALEPSELSNDEPDTQTHPALPKAVEPFRPMQVTECTSTMPGYYAPCFARKVANVVVAKEIIYPAFEMSAPIFAPSRPLDKQKWWDTTYLLWERAYKLGDGLRYNEKHGQLFVSLLVTL